MYFELVTTFLPNMKFITYTISFCHIFDVSKLAILHNANSKADTLYLLRRALTKHLEITRMLGDFYQKPLSV